MLPQLLIALIVPFSGFCDAYYYLIYLDCCLK